MIFWVLKKGDIIIAKFLLNRIPKDKAVSELASAIKDVGCQIMCLVIPGTVAAKFGYTIVGFDGNPIPDELLYKVIVIVDGQTRFSGIRRIRREHPDKLAPRVYALYASSVGRPLQDASGYQVEGFLLVQQRFHYGGTGKRQSG